MEKDIGGRIDIFAKTVWLIQENLMMQIHSYQIIDKNIHYLLP